MAAPRRQTTALRIPGLFARVAAMVAMLLQVAFYAEHLGATAVYEMGGTPLGARLGFLEICTGEGIRLVDPATGQTVGQTGGLPTSHSSSDCAVCSSASVCSFDAPGVAQAPILQAALVPAPLPPLPDRLAPIPRRDRATPIRAPPLV